MFKISKIATVLIFLIANNTSFAQEVATASDDYDANDYNANDYDADYFLDEGRLLFKIRLSGLLGDSKVRGLPDSTVANPQPVSALLKNGFALDSASTIFFADNLATEISLGLQMHKIKDAHFHNIANNYQGNAGSISKVTNLFAFPLAITAQFHIAPFGGVRPYIGGGYHYTYIYSKHKSFKASHTHGAIIQGGIDFISKDDSLITVDIRKMYLEPTIKYQNGIVGSNSAVSGKAKINPFVISIGYGFRF